MVASPGRFFLCDVKSKGKDDTSSLERIGIGKVKYLEASYQIFLHCYTYCQHGKRELNEVANTVNGRRFLCRCLIKIA